MRRDGPGSASSSLTVDRALGAAAALGVSLATYRTVRRLIEQLRDGESGGGPPAPAVPFLSGLLNIVTRAILAALRPSIGAEVLENGGEGDEYYRAAHGTGKIKRGGDEHEDDGEEVRHGGSCHCGAVRFTLLGPRTLSALDCPGKIRYPHHCTTADKFELVEGSERHLRVYYVALDDEAKDNDGLIRGEAQNMTVAKVAAHTFCDQCGVHVLRAPDASTDALEVNANCVDAYVGGIGVGGESGQGRTPTVLGKVRYYEDPVGGMGAGLPLPDHKQAALFGGDSLGSGNGYGQGEGAAQEDEEGEDRDAKFEAAVRNVFGITDSRHGRWRQEQHFEDSSLGGSAGVASANWANRTGWPNDNEDAFSAQKYGRETPSTSATSTSDLPSVRGLALSPQHDQHNYDTGEEVLAGRDEVDPGANVGEVSSMLDSIDDFSSAKGSSDEPSGHWREGPQSPQVEDSAAAPPSMNADQLRYFMKRHVGSSLSRESRSSDQQGFSP